MSVKRAFFGIFQKLTLFCCAIFFGFTNAFSANLPAGYTELEYIESRSSPAEAYIDTGLNFNSNYMYEITYAKGGLQNVFMGARGTTDYLAKGNFSLTYNNSSCVYSSTSTNSTPVNFGDTTFGVKHTVKYQQNTSTLLFDDMNRWDSNWITNIEIPYHVYLFAFNQGGTPGGSRKEYARIYAYSVKNSNGIFIQNFVPAKNSSGVVGMYDTVNNRFYTNQGTGEFTAGPVVLNPCRNLFDKDAMIHGAYIGASGTETYSAQHCYSNYIPVTPGQTYTFSAVRNQSASNKRIHAYDSNKNWIQQLGLSPSSSSVGPYDITVTIPSGISYILISGMKCDVDVADTNMQFEQGSTATAYVPYNASCHNTNGIKIATTAYNTARFSPVVNDLNSTVATIRDIVTNTINQTAAIASLQADKQTRPEDACPAGKKCLLVETEENGVIVPHWYPIIESADD